MEHLKKLLLKPEIFLAFFYLLIQLTLLDTLPDVMMDEPWYSNTAYNFTKTNYFTNTNVGYSGGDLFCFSVFITGIFIKLAGLSLWSVRLSSVFAGLIALLGFIRLLRELEMKINILIFTSLMFIFSNVFFIISRTARPEIWVISMGIWSLLFSFRYFREQKKILAMWSGIFAAFSFLSHPFGIISVMDSGIILLIAAFRQRKTAHLFYFSGAFLVFFGLPILYCLLNPGFYFIFFSSEFLHRNSVTGNPGIVDNIIQFTGGYVLGIKRLYVLIFELLILPVSFVVLRKENKIIPLLGMVNLVFGFVFLNPYLARSFGQVIVFSLMAFALSLNTVGNLKLNRVLFGVGIIYLVNNLAGDLYLIYMKRDNYSFSRLMEIIDRKIPDNKSVAAPIDFWFAFPENDFYCPYTEYGFKNYPDAGDMIRKNGVDYIVLSDQMISRYTATSGREDHVNPINLKFYNLLIPYAEENGVLIDEIDGKNYGRIRIWKTGKETVSLNE